MWNVNQTPEFQVALKNELHKSWVRVNNRVNALQRLSYSSDQQPYSLQDLIGFWIKKGNGLPELRSAIFNDATKHCERKVNYEALKAYVDTVSKDFSEKSYSILDSMGRYEKLRKFDVGCFKDESYDFLNTLFACFPDLVLNTPGLMTGAWKDEAFKPENAWKTIISLISGYQAFFVHRTHSHIGDFNPTNEFTAKFKDAFGVHPALIGREIPKIEGDHAKKVLSYYKRSVNKTAGREYSIPNILRYGFSDGEPALTVLAKSGVFGDRDVFNKLTENLGSDNRKNLLLKYLARGFCSEDKTARLFEPEDVDKRHIDYLLNDSHENYQEDFARFIKQFHPEDQADLQLKTGFPIDYLKDHRSKRIVLAHDLNL